MTNVNGIFDRAARRAEALPLARVVAAMLGVSAAFFALAMPPRILGGLVGLAGVSVEISMADQVVFALLFAALAAAAGWLALTLIAGKAAPGAVVAVAAAGRKRPVAAKRSDPAPTLRRGDAHPDAPSRRPIFAKDDLGTPFDEIVTDRRIVRGAPEAEFVTPDAPVDLDATRIADAPAIEEPALEDPALEDEEPAVEETAGEDQSADEVAAEDEAAAPIANLADDVPVAEPIADESEEALSPETQPGPDPHAETRPAAPREDDSIAALMARFEGGLGRLGGDTLPPPDPTALSTLKRNARHPDDALRDALAALQQMAARQR